jgi:predicted GNAT superfamily acetyltransferase
MNVRVRDAALADRDAILAINREGAPGVTLFEPREVERCIERATRFRVAERDGAVCGYLLAFANGFQAIGDEYAWFAARHDAFWYVDSIAISGRHRRAGVGSALYSDLEREARLRSVPRIVCEVNLEPPNPQSLAFHAARGFVEVGRLRVTDGRFVALLECEIAPGALQK